MAKLREGGTKLKREVAHLLVHADRDEHTVAAADLHDQEDNGVKCLFV